MPAPKSKIAAAILKDRGAPRGTSPDEQFAGAGMDDVDRGDWPEISGLDDSSIIPNNGKRGKGSQPGTTDGN